MHILVVEDDPLQRDCLAELLRDVGHVVRSASSGCTAATLIQSAYRFDAVILDLSLPGLSGSELLTLIRSTSGYETLPVVVASGLPAMDLAPYATLPHVAVLQKRFEVADVERALATLAEGQS